MLTAGANAVSRLLFLVTSVVTSVASRHQRRRTGLPATVGLPAGATLAACSARAGIAEHCAGHVCGRTLTYSSGHDVAAAGHRGPRDFKYLLVKWRRSRVGEATGGDPGRLSPPGPGGAASQQSALFTAGVLLLRAATAAPSRPSAGGAVTCGGLVLSEPTPPVGADAGIGPGCRRYRRSSPPGLAVSPSPASASAAHSACFLGWSTAAAECSDLRREGGRGLLLIYFLSPPHY